MNLVAFVLVTTIVVVAGRGNRELIWYKVSDIDLSLWLLFEEDRRWHSLSCNHLGHHYTFDTLASDHD